MDGYLQNIPTAAGEVGLAKVLLVRHEMIELKHIFTEIFHRESVDFDKILDYVGMTQFNYMKAMTTRMRRLHKIARFKDDPNKIIQYDFKSFFKYLDLAKTVGKTKIILDFDGVVTSKKFAPLYELCLDRARTEICTANPEVTEERFNRLSLVYPNKIYANKGKKKKLRTLITLASHMDYTFYVDDEPDYLDIAWLFGIKTFHYRNGNIYKHSLNSK